MINKHKHFAQLTFVQIDRSKEKEKQLIGEYWKYYNNSKYF